MSSIPICLKCEKPVYAAEELLAGGQKWHKVCFKCNLCNKRLDSTNVNAHDNALWCKQCYGRKFGPKGYGFGGKLLLRNIFMVKGGQGANIFEKQMLAYLRYTFLKLM